MPTSKRVFLMYEALRKGVTVEKLNEITHIGTAFIADMKELVDYEQGIRSLKWNELSDGDLKRAKELGFSDRYLSRMFSVPEKDVRNRRIALGKTARYMAIPVSGVEKASYYYSTYRDEADEVPVSSRRKIMILGGGPNRIGQGIEFDYTCVHAAHALREESFETIMVTAIRRRSPRITTPRTSSTRAAHRRGCAQHLRKGKRRASSSSSAGRHPSTSRRNSRTTACPSSEPRRRASGSPRTVNISAAS